MSGIYKLKYMLYPIPGEYTKEELKFTEEEMQEAGKNIGGCDKLFLASILTDENEATSYVTVGIDGHTGEELDPYDVFKLWLHMGCTLSEAKDLPFPFKEISAWPFKTYVDIIEALDPHTAEEKCKGTCSCSICGELRRRKAIRDTKNN